MVDGAGQIGDSRGGVHGGAEGVGEGAEEEGVYGGAEGVVEEELGERVAQGEGRLVVLFLLLLLLTLFLLLRLLALVTGFAGLRSLGLRARGWVRRKDGLEEFLPVVLCERDWPPSSSFLRPPALEEAMVSRHHQRQGGGPYQRKLGGVLTTL